MPLPDREEARFVYADGVFPAQKEGRRGEKKGSNSKMLSEKLAALFAGRCIELKIVPFSFSESYEYCRIQGKAL